MCSHATTRLPLGPYDRVFVLTGAGISAESGLATFRGSDGLWEGERVQDVATPRGWKRDPERVWRFYSLRRSAALAAQPNAAHTALAELEERLGDRFFLCTQNVDDLHERAGSANLVHMHGELFQSCCDSCTRASFRDEQLYLTKSDHALCDCGGRIRPDIVWFGEVPYHMERIFEELARCTVMLVIGTSGVVQPAASFVHWANEHHPQREAVRTYYVGPEHPANAAAFHKIFDGRASEVLPALLAAD
ncbi:MAG: Sir2 family NAD-dependent protein deacetylase [Acidobacteriota bacterium]|nr:Sir2 family NAD-dependent protein deacetylase [Acidobacteriota bacterium]